MTNGIADIIVAARGEDKIMFPNLPADAPLRTELDRLAEGFQKLSFVGFLRYLFLGGSDRADLELYAHKDVIPKVLEQVSQHTSIGFKVPDAELIKAVLHLEANYSGDIPLIGKTAPPMNVNYDLWKPVFDAYNERGPEKKITRRSIEEDPAANITAAALVLGTLDAAIDPALQNPARRAMITSLYANTELTLRTGKPLAYAGMIERYIANNEQMRIPPIFEDIIPLIIPPKTPMVDKAASPQR